jgi:hypothetical protein
MGFRRGDNQGSRDPPLFNPAFCAGLGVQGGRRVRDKIFENLYNPAID